MEAKSSSQSSYSWRFSQPEFANCVYTKTMFVHVSERELLFSLNWRKFAVERDWNRGNSQNFQNLGFFGKNRWVFSRKNLQVFENRYMWQFFFWNESQMIFSLEKVLPLYFWGFFGKNQRRYKVGKVRKYDEETECFKKTLTSF